MSRPKSPKTDPAETLRTRVELLALAVRLHPPPASVDTILESARRMELYATTGQVDATTAPSAAARRPARS